MAGGRSGYYKHVGLAVVLLLFFHEGVLCQPRLVTFRPTTHFTVASSDGIIAIQGEVYFVHHETMRLSQDTTVAFLQAVNPLT